MTIRGDGYYADGEAPTPKGIGLRGPGKTFEIDDCASRDQS